MPSRLPGGADTDSSHYESYGEDEDGVTDRAHYLRRPPATGPDGEPPGRPQAQLCGFLWRKRWLGQWAKQLFIVREHTLLVSGRRRMDGGWERVFELCRPPLVPLQCFRCAADPQPVLEVDLRGCRVTYKAKRGKKMPHTLKVMGMVGEVLVIGFQSQQQAEDWRKVWRCCSLAELCVGRREGAQPCWDASEAAGGDPIRPQLLSHPRGAWSPVRWGSGSPGLQRSPCPSAGD